MTLDTPAPPIANWRVGAPAEPDSAEQHLRAGEGARSPSVFWENLEP
jgi:hypothetical protein